MLPIPSKFCTIQGLAIRYAVFGQGKPLILIHGLGAMMEYWYKNISYWAKNYQVFVFDLPGFGYSEAPEDCGDVNYYVDFVKNFMDECSIQTASVVAHSFGGAIALRFSECHPSYVNKLVLLSNVGFATQVEWGFRLLTLPILGKMLLNASPLAFARVLRAHVDQPACLQDDFIDIIYKAQCGATPQRVLLAILQRNVNLFGIKAKMLSEITSQLDSVKELPILIMWGKQDLVLNYTIHTAAAKIILPAVPIVAIDHCGHLPQLEQSDLVNEAVLEFLQC